jgi:uncharacterized hydrophobic protein (TIGR00271 family)
MKQSDLIKQLLHFFNLEAELDDFDKIHESITKDIVFKGTNLWILIFAIVVASIGLNMNSTAVIIGAMLISPLMGPINGMGYSLATYNFPLFRQAVKNFSFAVGASLTTSMLYFTLSPISTAHSELLARTSPTIYDVLIALFGGMAGVVAISSKLKGNVIPGVAIATALMPPLCTAGYGLATGQFSYFFGAFYLFTINTAFIALSSVAVSQILKFPIRTILEPKEKKRVNQWITLVISLILIPSIYFGYILVKKEQFATQAAAYIQNISVVDGNYLLKHDIKPNTKTISLVYGGTSLDDQQKELIRQKARDFNITDATIEFKPGLSFDVVNRRNAEVDQLKSELNNLSKSLTQKTNSLDSLLSVQLQGKQLLREIQTIYPQIQTCTFADTYLFSSAFAEPQPTKIIVFNTAGPSISPLEKKNINAWLAVKLNSNDIRVIYESSATNQ